MSRRAGTCQEPGPREAHCTDDPGHRYSCYDAGEDVSWNEGQWYDFDLAPHDCGDPKCPDLGYRGPEGRQSEHGQDEASDVVSSPGPARTEGNYCLDCGSYQCAHAHATYPPAGGAS